MRGSIKGIASVYMIVYFLTLAHQLFPHHHNIEADTHPKDHSHDHHSPSLLANFLDLIKDIYEVDLGQNHLEEYLSNTSYQFNKQPIVLTSILTDNWVDFEISILTSVPTTADIPLWVAFPAHLSSNSRRGPPLQS